LDDLYLNFLIYYRELCHFKLWLILPYVHLNWILKGKQVGCSFESKLWLVLILNKLNYFAIPKHSGKFNIIKAGKLDLLECKNHYLGLQKKLSTDNLKPF
jgi:hypothetical protein